MARIFAAMLCVVLGLLLFQQQPLTAPELAARVTTWLQPLPPQQVVETLRADLSGGDPDPNTMYQPSRSFEAFDLTYQGKQRHWSWIVPDVPPADLPPVVVLLHGSGRNGAAMLDMWQAIGRSDALLIAPDSLDPSVWNAAVDGPQYLDAVLAAAFAQHPFDRNRVFLYGHSAGAIHALYLAKCRLGPWRAVAVHAGAVPDCATINNGIAAPVLIQNGDQDALFDLALVRQTAADLGQAGHKVRLDVIPVHSHWYYDVGQALAADAWSFFSEQAR